MRVADTVRRLYPKLLWREEFYFDVLGDFELWRHWSMGIALCDINKKGVEIGERQNRCDDNTVGVECWQRVIGLSQNI